VTVPEPTTEAEKHFLWVSPLLPKSITKGLVAPVVLEQVEEKDAATLILEIGETGRQVTSLSYALVAPFPTFEDEVSFDQLKNSWLGDPTGVFSEGKLFLTKQTLAIFRQWWGVPDDKFIWVVSEEELLDTTWSYANSWALIPFEALRPEWKVLQVDGISPVWNDFDSPGYPLNVPISLDGQNSTVVDQLSEALAEQIPMVLNRDPNLLTTVVLTGVTALVRATAVEMETKGVLYPAEQVGPLLQSADITHISNEVPFASTCPPPAMISTRLVFCSADKYLELLEYIGTDVVELTGDHFSDWGIQATLHTFDLYDAEGWVYYGGGRTPEQGRLPIKLEHNGNKIAFIGCNGKGGTYTPSTNGQPGAVDCDFPLVSREIAKLKEEGYLVIMTFQHHEVYSFTPSPYLVVDFEFAADAGADIVSGSQAHQPHGMSFYHGSTIMYGLGNLFFDQLLMGENTSRALIARHVMYAGEHISTEIFTIYFTDFSRPLYLTGEGRIRLLRQVFSESDWGELTYAIKYN
jgi:poly-gamma-glutamate synthesis protein (capsule biosynthesis protein)